MTPDASRWRAVLALILTSGCLQLCEAHVRLTFPVARYPSLDFLDNVRTPPPCGVPKPAADQAQVTTLKAGSRFTITWFQSYAHNGGFRIELLDGNQSVIRTLTPESPQFIGVNNITQESYQVQLPEDFLCDACTIRLLRQATEWGPKYQFWSCADVSIVSDELQTCSEGGKFNGTHCECDRLYSGDMCENKDDCWDSSDCNSHGSCVTLDTSVYPKRVCYCQIGYFGRQCSEVSQLKSRKFDPSQYQTRTVQKNKIFWRILAEKREIEFVLQYHTRSWLAVGWRPSGLNQQCQMKQKQNKTLSKLDEHVLSEPEPTAEHNASVAAEPEPKAEPNGTAEPEPKAEPKGTAEPEPKAEPKGTAEPEPKPEHSTGAPVGVSNQSASAEPRPEPEPATTPTTANETESADIEASTAGARPAIAAVADLTAPPSSQNVTTKDESADEVLAQHADIGAETTAIRAETTPRPEPEPSTPDPLKRKDINLNGPDAQQNGLRPQFPIGVNNSSSGTPDGENIHVMRPIITGANGPRVLAGGIDHVSTSASAVDLEALSTSGTLVPEGTTVEATTAAAETTGAQSTPAAEDDNVNVTRGALLPKNLRPANQVGSTRRPGAGIAFISEIPVETDAAEATTASISEITSGAVASSTLRVESTSASTARASEAATDAAPTSTAAPTSAAATSAAAAASTAGAAASSSAARVTTPAAEEVTTADLAKATSKVEGDVCYGEWHWPPNCVDAEVVPAGKTSCEYKVNWNFRDETDDIEFSMRYRSPNNWWTAIGFSATGSMQDADFVLIKTKASQVVIEDAHSSGVELDAPVVDEKQNLTPQGGSYVSGVTRATFVRPRTTDDARYDVQFTDGDCYYFLFVTNGARINADGSLSRMEEMPRNSSVPVCIKKCAYRPPVVKSCQTEFKYPPGCQTPACDYRAVWTYDPAAQDVIFEITAKELGRWTGIGFSRDGNMTGSDVIIGWIYDEQPYVSDRYAYGKHQPSMDAVQNVNGVSGRKVDDYQVISFKRKLLVTDDKEDISLGDCVYYLFPVGGGRVLARTAQEFADKAAPVGYHDWYIPRVSKEPICICTSTGEPVVQKEKGSRAKRQADEDDNVPQAAVARRKPATESPTTSTTASTTSGTTTVLETSEATTSADAKGTTQQNLKVITPKPLTVIRSHRKGTKSTPKPKSAAKRLDLDLVSVDGTLRHNPVPVLEGNLNLTAAVEQIIINSSLSAAEERAKPRKPFMLNLANLTGDNLAGFVSAYTPKKHQQRGSSNFSKLLRATSAANLSSVLKALSAEGSENTLAHLVQLINGSLVDEESNETSTDAAETTAQGVDEATTAADLEAAKTSGHPEPEPEPSTPAVGVTQANATVEEAETATPEPEAGSTTAAAGHSKAEPHAEPEKTVEPEPEPTSTAESHPKPEPEKASDAHPEPEPESDDQLSSLMDCTDVIVGSAIGSMHHILDYYTVSRATPRTNMFYGAKDSLTAALGYEENGITTLIFRKPLDATQSADHSFVNETMTLIWAQGQETADVFYPPNVLKYHGRMRGSFRVNFFDEMIDHPHETRPEPSAEPRRKSGTTSKYSKSASTPAAQLEERQADRSNGKYHVSLTLVGVAWDEALSDVHSSLYADMSKRVKQSVIKLFANKIDGFKGVRNVQFWQVESDDGATSTVRARIEVVLEGHSATEVREFLANELAHSAIEPSSADRVKMDAHSVVVKRASEEKAPQTESEMLRNYIIIGVAAFLVVVAIVFAVFMILRIRRGKAKQVVFNYAVTQPPPSQQQLQRAPPLYAVPFCARSVTEAASYVPRPPIYPTPHFYRGYPSCWDEPPPPPPISSSLLASLQTPISKSALDRYHSTGEVCDAPQVKRANSTSSMVKAASVASLKSASAKAESVNSAALPSRRREKETSVDAIAGGLHKKSSSYGGFRADVVGEPFDPSKKPYSASVYSSRSSLPPLPPAPIPPFYRHF